jgi:hypothetical protein
MRAKKFGEDVNILDPEKFAGKELLGEGNVIISKVNKKRKLPGSKLKKKLLKMYT